MIINDIKDNRIKIRNGFKYIPKYALTEEELLEYTKCKTDPLYFINNYFYIKNLDSGIIEQFKAYPKQNIVVQVFNLYHFVIVLKSRQTGLSTLGAGICTWGMIFFDNWGAGVISRRGRDAVQFGKKVKTALTEISEKHPFLMQPVVTDNVHFKELANGSTLTISTTNPEGLRGDTINFLFIDEAAFAKNIEDFFDASAITLSRIFAQKVKKDGSFDNTTNRPWGVIISSTPNGKKGDGKFFYETWKYAKHLNSNIPQEQQNEYIPIKFHWSEVDVYDENWYNKQVKILRNNKMKILQELELMFLDSTSNILPEDILKKIYIMNTPYKKYYKNKLYIYIPPKQGREYIIGGDLASGETINNNPDESAFVVIDAHSGLVMADFSAYTKYIPFAKIIVEIALLYNNALIAIERQGGGIQTIQYIRDVIQYANLYKHVDENKRNISDPIYGFPTTTQTRNLIIDQMVMFLYDQPCINSNRLLSQITSLENRNGKIAAYGDAHDDLVMAFAIAIEVRRKVYGYDVGTSFASDLVNNNSISVDNDNVLNITKSINDYKSVRDFNLENKVISNLTNVSNELNLDISYNDIDSVLDKVYSNYGDPLLFLNKLVKKNR